MPCFHPLVAYKSLTERTPNGKSVIVFNSANCNSSFEEIELPCSQCIGCRIDRSRQWALRCVHEASLFNYNCFITLTFSDVHLDECGSLVKSDFQKFMKRLRKRFSGIDAVSTDGVISYPIRYFHCGEYGSELSRPHHHACLFNFDFPDKILWSVRDDVRLFRSPALEELWPFGFCTIGEVSYQSAAYVSRYITKKVNGSLAESHYRRVDESTGECWQIEPEFITMSRRPGIGRRWFDKYKTDVFPKDFISFEGKKFKSPAYYDRVYDSIDPVSFENIKFDRKLALLKHSGNNTKKRLAVREQVQLSKCDKLIRSIEL